MYQIMSFGYIEGIHLKLLKIVRSSSLLLCFNASLSHTQAAPTHSDPIMFYAGLMLVD